LTCRAFAAYADVVGSEGQTDGSSARRSHAWADSSPSTRRSGTLILLFRSSLGARPFPTTPLASPIFAGELAVDHGELAVRTHEKESRQGTWRACI